MLFARAVGGPHGADGARRRSSWPPSAAPGCSAGTTRSARSRSGKLADLALWRLDTLAHADIADPVAALVLGSPPPLELLLVDGRPVVERDRLVDRRRGRGWPATPSPRRDAAAASGATDDRPTDDSTADVRTGDRGGVGDEPAAPGRHAQGHRRVRLRQRPLDGRHALGRHPAQPAPVRPDPSDRHRPRRWPLPGVFAVLTARRRARARSATGWSARTSRCSPMDVVRYQGEPVALVAADHPEIARRAAKQIVVDYEVLEPVTDPRRARARRWATSAEAREPRAASCTRAATSSATSRSASGDPDADAPTSSSSRRLRGRHAGPGVPRAGVRARRARRGRRRRPLRRDAVAARRPAADLRGARAAARAGAAARWPASAVRSAAARTCRCTCTPACSRCTPASR